MKLQEGETVLHELRPERSILAIWFFTKCLPLTLIALALLVFFVAFCAVMETWSSTWVLLGEIAGILVVLGILVLTLLYCSCLRRTYVYYVTDQRCVFHGGILRRVERSVPYHKITDVEMSQDIVERVLGISRLNIFTPGTGSIATSSTGAQRAEICFVGLKDNETPAATINNILRKFRATGE